ncbi:hypothetical protein [Haloarchaeobius sp. DT45]|uniref:hypothetical protein n=1 Tax=Haloarchaeobius sp. DT45 TaxID=3446116 RepID=UPI003F6C4415
MATTTPREDLDDGQSSDDDRTVTRLERGSPHSMVAALQAVLSADAELLVGRTDSSLDALEFPESYRTRRATDAETVDAATCTLDAVVTANPTHGVLVDSRRALRPNGYLVVSLAVETGYAPLAVAGFEPVLELVVDGGETLVVLAQAA